MNQGTSQEAGTYNSTDGEESGSLHEVGLTSAEHEHNMFEQEL